MYSITGWNLMYIMNHSNLPSLSDDLDLLIPDYSSLQDEPMQQPKILSPSVSKSELLKEAFTWSPEFTLSCFVNFSFLGLPEADPLDWWWSSSSSEDTASWTLTTTWSDLSLLPEIGDKAFPVSESNSSELWRDGVFTGVDENWFLWRGIYNFGLFSWHTFHRTSITLFQIWLLWVDPWFPWIIFRWSRFHCCVNRWGGTCFSS